MGQRLKIGSLCTGYGGLDLAVEEHFNAETVWCAEFDKYASKVIEQRFNIPNYGNIKEIDWALLEPIDILTAGYPCQPFSTAGERKGTDDERHIFPYILEAISILRPRWVILENVRGHLTLGLKEVLAGLATIGYDARWQVVRASDAGAPHQRARVFIVAYPNSQSRGVSSQDKETAANTESRGSGSEPFGVSTTNTGTGCHCETITNSNCNACEKSRRTNSSVHGSTSEIINRTDRKKHWDSSEIVKRELPPTLDQQGKLNAVFVEYMMGLPIGWVTGTGLSRAQQLKILGNGVVPQQAKLALELSTEVIHRG